MNRKWYNVFPEVPEDFHERVMTTVTTLEKAGRKNFIKKERVNIMEQNITYGRGRVFAALGGVVAAIMLVIFGGGYLVYSGILGGGGLTEPYLPATSTEADSIGELEESTISQNNDIDIIVEEVVTVEVDELTQGHYSVRRTDLVESAIFRNKLYEAYIRNTLNIFDKEDGDSNYRGMGTSLDIVSSGYTDSVTDSGTTVTIFDIIGDNRNSVIFLEIKAPEGVEFKPGNYPSQHRAANPGDIEEWLVYVNQRIPVSVADTWSGVGFGCGGLEFLTVGETPNIGYFSIRFSISAAEFSDIDDFNINFADIMYFYEDYDEAELFLEGVWSFGNIKVSFPDTVLKADESLFPAPHDTYIATGAEISPLGFTLFYDEVPGHLEPFNKDGLTTSGYIEYNDGTRIKLYASASQHTEGVSGEIQYISIIPIDLSRVEYINIDGDNFSAFKLFNIY